MAYTVQEVANLTGTTVKTLYHYQKIGLLFPNSIGDNGYRYYTDKELERLQQIMFYRELDFSLEQIKIALENEPNRLICLEKQKALLSARKERLAAILNTLEETISNAQKGVSMDAEKMFGGLNKEAWTEALEDQNKYLESKYGYTLDTDTIDATVMNEKAEEATQFMSFMAQSLKKGIGAHDEKVVSALKKHIAFMKKDMDIDAAGFAAQAHFFATDDFHRSMLEGQQVGLSYYICVAADNLVAQGNT